MNKGFEAHPFPPVFDVNSKILILGSFPSVKSRENGFYYGHPQNRFWRVLAAVYGENVPALNEEKKEFLLSHGIALWDSIKACDIEGSSDISIKNAVPNDLSVIFKNADIKEIFANGKASERVYNKYIFPITGRAIKALPSTSPANAAFTLENLVDKWSVIKKSSTNLFF